MTDLFLKILNMSISASWLILAVILLRFLLKKVPKWVMVLLWGIVGVRLLWPFTMESALSLVPSAETVSPDIQLDPTPAIQSGVPYINNVVNPVISQTFAPAEGASANPLQIWLFIAAVVWAVGITVMALYTLVTWFCLRRRVCTAVRLRDNIYQSEQAASPFVLGIFRPRIYLPFRMEPKDMESVIAHEQTHIRRKDHWWKPLGFLTLAIHWFNPLVWAAYILLCRDIELACDEKVIRDMDVAQRADYSQTLLSCSVSRRSIAACPLAFGEVGVKARIKNVLHYKKPAYWIILAALILCVAAAVCFLTDPVSASIADFGSISTETSSFVQIYSPNGLATLNDPADLETVVEFLETTGLKRVPISLDRSEDRPKDYSIVWYNGDVSTAVYFDDSATSVWIDDSVKPTLSYAVKDPEQVKDFFVSFLGGGEDEASSVSAGDRLPVGDYVMEECVYVNLFSSYLPMPEDYAFTVTEDSFLTYFRGSVSTITPAQWQWQSVEDVEKDLAFLKGVFFTGNTLYDALTGKGALYQKLDSKNHLILRNGQLYLIQGGNTRNEMERVWFIYRLAPAGSSSLTSD